MAFCDLRAFQEINSPTCGMGVLTCSDRLTSETDVPQEIFGYFFIWKSLTCDQAVLN
ncbi:MAG: hypothetical protein SAK29_36015 [Scytonema sp. PMC 1069.18]|nr:hypothetical protein [Scytonema sp. PMC 1069.18]